MMMMRHARCLAVNDNKYAELSGLLPTCPQYADMAFTKESSPVGRNETSLAKPSKDEALAERGVNQAYDECQNPCGDDV